MLDNINPLTNPGYCRDKVYKKAEYRINRKRQDRAIEETINEANDKLEPYKVKIIAAKLLNLDNDRYFRKDFK